MSQFNEEETPKMMTSGQEQAKSSYGQNPAAAGAQAAGNQINGQFQAAGDFQAQGMNPQDQSGQNFSQAFQYQGQAPQNSYGQYQKTQAAPPDQGQFGYQFQEQAPQSQYAQNMQQNLNQGSQQSAQATGPFGPATGNSPNDHGQELKHENNMFQHGQLMDIISGIINGNPDMQKISGLLNTADTQFWKGAAVGAGAALLLGNAAVQSAMAGFVGGLFNKNTPNTTNNNEENK